MNKYKVYAGNKTVFVNAETKEQAKYEAAKMFDISNWRYSVDAILWEENINPTSCPILDLLTKL